MPHYSVVSVTPTTDTWIPTYLAAVGPLVAKHGGRYLARTASHQPLEGGGPAPALQVILEWPSKEAEAAFYADPGYAGTAPRGSRARRAPGRRSKARTTS